MYKIIDLFCGIGGFSYGFEMTGQFEIILGVDCWGVALETFRLNHSSTCVVKNDIKNLNQEFWKQYTGTVDVIIAGPPCQGFSMAGRRENLDERNNLFKEVVRVASIVKPQIIVIENVLGLISMKTPDGNFVKDVIFSSLNQIGYNVDMRVLKASEYGVPQNRKRVIFIASLKNNITFPKIKLDGTTKQFVTVGDALGNIPNNEKRYLKPQNEYQKIMAGRTDIANHEPIKHSELVVRRMSTIPQGGNWQNIPLELYQGGGQHSNNYRRLKSDEPSITIIHASKSMIIHHHHDRTPTVREVARLQSFNDDFILTGTKYNQHQQLANAVPPILGKAIGENILEMLRDCND